MCPDVPTHGSCTISKSCFDLSYNAHTSTRQTETVPRKEGEEHHGLYSSLKNYTLGYRCRSYKVVCSHILGLFHHIIKIKELRDFGLEYSCCQTLVRALPVPHQVMMAKVRLKLLKVLLMLTW
ncbi:hypothetical protein EGW08_004137 [Elysia chlorotica]|uniref:Uncharacterized protein n=1 Tax=Elysia chlorotica TaxID=188477 RepID=A0A3S0ZVZ9_ELYCH|nr:hypothetical protein EGW08_004137 [Elysia chlorotica]